MTDRKTTAAANLDKARQEATAMAGMYREGMTGMIEGLVEVCQERIAAYREKYPEDVDAMAKLCWETLATARRETAAEEMIAAADTETKAREAYITVMEKMYPGRWRQ